MEFISGLLGGSSNAKNPKSDKATSDLEVLQTKFQLKFDTRVFFLTHSKSKSWYSWAGYDHVAWQDAKKLMHHLRDNTVTFCEKIDQQQCGDLRKIRKPSVFTNIPDQPEQANETDRSMDYRTITKAYNGRIDIIMHTDGGDLQSTSVIIKLLLNYEGPVHVWIPYRAMSAGTAIAMTADNIHLHKTAFMGQIDPQYRFGLAVSDFTMESGTMTSWVGDLYRMVSKSAERVLKDWDELVNNIITHHSWDQEQSDKIKEELLLGKYYHGKPMFYDEIGNILPNVGNDDSSETWNLVDDMFRALEDIDHKDRVY